MLKVSLLFLVILYSCKEYGYINTEIHKKIQDIDVKAIFSKYTLSKRDEGKYELKLYGKVTVKNCGKKPLFFRFKKLQVQLNGISSSAIYIDSIASILFPNEVDVNEEISFKVYWIFLDVKKENLGGKDRWIFDIDW